MMARSHLLSPAFRALSARLGQDPLQVQGPGGNTSIKDDTVMWIKASGTELANAENSEIFVAVDRSAALAEAREEAGDGSCKSTVLDASIGLRPSIETTFHAALSHPVVVHTHSVATLVHATSVQGLALLEAKLRGLAYTVVPYAKPGLPLTKQILSRSDAETQVIILQNHGLICCGASVEEVSNLVAEVEARLRMPVLAQTDSDVDEAPLDGFTWSEESWIASDAVACKRVLSGSYYPDHVVFLGPALPILDHDGAPPAVVQKGQGILLRDGATSSQKAMLRCISDLLSRVPEDWTLNAIGAEAEASLLDWDAEKYRQALAERT
ncbi:MAG: class II aldolase/adducin family protein [Dinoroseobacter sp.]|nr:class II aldolase/adducin family protein [Dinoroseobacter sp.]